MTAALAVAMAACGPAAAADPPISAAEAKTTLELARAARSAGDLGAAIGLYRRLDRPRADPGVEVEFGDALLQAGMVDDAIGVYQAVRPGSNAEVGAMLGLDAAYSRLREPDKALQFAERAVKVAPRDETALVAEGVALDRVGRRHDAQAAYRSALTISPRSVAARNDLALSLALDGSFAEAVDILAPMASSSDAAPQVRQNLALVYGLQGDRVQSMAWSRADLADQEAQANQQFFDSVSGRAK